MLNRYFTSLVIISTIILITGCSASRLNVLKVDQKQTEIKNDGIYYALPQTFIRIDITITKTETIKGPYSEFASKYLGLTNVVGQNSSSYELTGLRVRSENEPDPNQFYYVELSNKNLKNEKNLMLSLTDAGLIQNTNGCSKVTDSSINDFRTEEELNIYPDVFKYYADINLFEQVDTIIEKVVMDTITVEKKVLKRKMVEKSPEQKAKNAADFIIKIKENRFNLISGQQEVNYDKETFRYMNEELEKLENEYKKLFTGLNFTKTLNYSFVILPNSIKSTDSIPLFKFSKLKGVLDTSSVYGDLVYIKIKKSGITSNVAAFEKVRNVTIRKKHGFYYRIPEYGLVDILQSGLVKVSGKFLVSQYGVVTYLPPKEFAIEYYPKTGSIKSVK
jgi:hypothetical protein